MSFVCKMYFVSGVWQVESRSHKVWGGETGLEVERLNKVEKREKQKEKKYTKDIKGLL